MKLKRVLLMLAVSGALLFTMVPQVQGGSGGGRGGGTRISSFGYDFNDSGYSLRVDDSRDLLRACGVLGLGPNCIDVWSKVKAAYHKLARASHPDKNMTDGEKKKKEENFREVQDAYAVLYAAHKKRKRTEPVHDNPKPPQQLNGTKA